MRNKEQVQVSELVDAREDALVTVRRRGSFLIAALMWAAAGAGAFVLAGYLVVVLNTGLQAGERVRESIGLHAPTEGPDWFLLAVLAVIIGVPVGTALGLWFWYRRVWQGRLRKIWAKRPDRRRYSRIHRLKPQASSKELDSRVTYLKALLATPAWRGLVPNVTEETHQTSKDLYRELSGKVLKEIENDVSERAIATGLIVGLGSSRIDRLTIVAAALEMQLHVLSRLGKKPSIAMWRELLKRTSASIFFNTYLNREDTLAISFMIHRAALGIARAGELSEDAADMLSDLGDGDELADEALEEGVGGIVDGIPFSGLLKTAGAMTLGVGASGLQAISALTREAGNELLQGALAGGVLYYHGMAIAADVLALDDAHRQSPEMNRTPLQGATRTAGVAGQLLRGQVRRYRGAYRERQRAALRSVKRLNPRRKPSSVRQRSQTPVTDSAPDLTQSFERPAPATQSWWRLRRTRGQNPPQPGDGESSKPHP